MYYFYYWLKNINTNEIIRITTADFMGDIGDKINYRGKHYIIEDWVDEYCDFIEPEY